jgi:hypothetical protein
MKTLPDWVCSGMARDDLICWMHGSKPWPDAGTPKSWSQVEVSIKAALRRGSIGDCGMIPGATHSC